MYTASKFNLYFDDGDSNFLFNSHTGAFVSLDTEYQSSVRLLKEGRLKEIPVIHVDKLKEAGFMIGKEVNENLFYTYITNKSKYSEQFLGLTIATTLQCNFRCPYCYEEHLDSYFDENKEQALLEFIKNHMVGKETLSITWYGGEPLLQKEMIRRVSKELIAECDEKNINYNFSMVSNGYLLSRKVAEMLVNECKVTSVQITLDGGPDTHDQTRYLRSGDGTFHKIMENIKDVYDLLNIVIRVNVSQNNVEDVHKLFPILLENNLNKKVGLYFAPVTSHEGTCQSVSESCLLTEEFSKWEMELIKHADLLGFDMGKMYPSNLGGSVCTAVNNNSFVIDSEGDLFKCWNEVGKKELRVGSITEGLANAARYVEWVEWQFPDKCNECSIFPLCKGRCPDMSRNGEDFECNQLKYNIVERLLRFYKLKSSSELQEQGS
ncbi:radical SAM/SPASM domain-containing protein [Paenibacillus sp. FSL M7-0420]|uniref:radical SAM/SPASM domain-containing protein n=1 Tax=Paenibacillus sp. FSL M7-0420 TaxID=2921609 RepID=UPI0030F89B93